MSEPDGAVHVWSEARTRQLQFLLWACVVVGVLLMLLTLVAPIAAVAAVVVLGTSGIALRALPDRDRRAKTAVIVAGAVQILVAVLMARSGLGILPSIVGVLLVLLAVLREPEEGQP